MAEVLGSVSAVAGLVSLSGTILAEGYSFVASVYRAPQELKELLSEIAALDTVLGQLQGVCDDSTNLDLRKSFLNDLTQAGLITDCRDALVVVNKSISQCRQVAGQNVRNFGRRILWPFKEKETKETITRLARIREHLAASLTVDIAHTLRNVHVATKITAIDVLELRKWTARHDDIQDRKALMKWLNPNAINIDENLAEGAKQHHPGTGQWLLDSQKFHSWANGPSSLMWIHGIREKYRNRNLNNANDSIAGSGKTVLASFIVEKFRGGAYSSDGVVYFFCDHRNSTKQTLQDFLSVAVVQLLHQRPALEHIAVGLFHEHDSDPKRTIRPRDLTRIFNEFAKDFSSMSIIIDALDECKDIVDLADCLRDLLGMLHTTIRILTTSRYDHSLEASIGALATHRLLLEQNIAHDIQAFVADEVNSRIKARKLKVRSADLKNLIVKVLSSHARGMFIWVSFQLSLISQLSNDKAIREAIYKLPRSLEDTYLRLLEQAKERSSANIDILAKALKWIVSSRKPLKLSQLAEAVSIEPSDTCRDIDKMMTDDRDLLDMLGSLVAVDATKKDPVISLVHFTLYEFLHSDLLRAHDSLSLFYVPSTFTGEIGAICAQYLSFSDFEEPCQSMEALRDRKSSYRLLRYAATSWIPQIATYGSRGPGVKAISAKIEWFLAPGCKGNHYFSWLQVLHNVVADFKDYSGPTQPLHYAVRFNMVYLFDVLLNNGEDPAILLEQGYTPLHIAVIKGDTEGVASVLRKEPDLEAPAFHGQTALHLAASYGNANIVKLLLEAGASIFSQSDSKSTPFYRAARSGSIPVMDILLQAGSSIEAKTWDAWTPIFEAIENLHVAAVEWLVKNGANLNRRLRDSPGGPSVLEFARRIGNQEIINIIERGLILPNR